MGRAEMAIGYKGEDIRVGFNPQYIKEGLEAISSKRCRFMFEGPRRAGIFKEVLSGPPEVLSEGFVYAVMPALLPAEN